MSAVCNAMALRRAAAEAVGTFGLVFAGCGAVVVDALSGAG
jgi:glycerol uptake facilitator-like aquaporin